jgi:hypothetical protein
MKIDFIGDTFLSRAVLINRNTELTNVVLNLEAPLSSSGVPAKSKINLFMDPENLFETFKDINIVAVNLANNHIMDYGEDAFKKTIDILKNKGIKYFGAGSSDNNFNNPVIIGSKTALFGYSCSSTHAVFGNDKKIGSAYFDTEQVIKDIEAYRDKYFITVCLHWGREYYSFPKPEDIKKAKHLIDSGADLIIGNHTHMIQSYEIFNGKYIFYSQGNAIFHDGIVDSYFDGEKFNRKFKMFYPKKNRISWKVSLDESTKAIIKSFMIYDKKELKRYESFLLEFKTRMIFPAILYKLYSIYKNKMFTIKFRLNKLRGN